MAFKELLKTIEKICHCEAEFAKRRLRVVEIKGYYHGDDLVARGRRYSDYQLGRRQSGRNSFAPSNILLMALEDFHM